MPRRARSRCVRDQAEEGERPAPVRQAEEGPGKVNLPFLDKEQPVPFPGLTGHEGLIDIGLGGQVRAAALEQAQLDAADLGAGLPVRPP